MEKLKNKLSTYNYNKNKKQRHKQNTCNKLKQWTIQMSNKTKQNQIND